MLPNVTTQTTVPTKTLWVELGVIVGGSASLFLVLFFVILNLPDPIAALLGNVLGIQKVSPGLVAGNLAYTFSGIVSVLTAICLLAGLIEGCYQTWVKPYSQELSRAFFWVKYSFGGVMVILISAILGLILVYFGEWLHEYIGLDAISYTLHFSMGIDLEFAVSVFLIVSVLLSVVVNVVNYGLFLPRVLGRKVRFRCYVGGSVIFPISTMFILLVLGAVAGP